MQNGCEIPLLVLLQPVEGCKIESHETTKKGHLEVCKSTFQKDDREINIRGGR